MGKSRASVFSDADEGAIDLSGFAPKPPVATTLPSKEQVKAISEAAHFPSREVPKAKLATQGPRKPRRHRTGRNVQFNAKASQTTIDRFYALCDLKSWVLGYTLERAVDALERELKAKP
jgi:hypothetical protein